MRSSNVNFSFRIKVSRIWTDIPHQHCIKHKKENFSETVVIFHIVLLPHKHQLILAGMEKTQMDVLFHFLRSSVFQLQFKVY